ncbi:hypothetical protein BHM03_00005484 [Ensete ventricosum]|nr:hypothetical protein BHM03_00005484 [Ensete ventricosum]
MEEDDTVCIEDRLKALGIVTEKVDLRTKDHASNPTNTVLDICSGGIISVDVNMPPKKVCVSNMVLLTWLILFQMDKAAGKKASMDEHHVEGDKMLDEDEDYVDAEEDDDKDEEIDEMVYGEDESGSDEDDQHQT